VTLPLESWRLKLARAQEHLDALNAAYKRYTDLDPHAAVTTNNPDTGKYVMKVSLVERIPVELGLILGDYLQNLRASLDHTIWELSTAPDERTGFPFYRDEKDFDKAASSKFGTIPDAAKLVLREVQPFQDAAPADHPLWLLHRLSIEDRHHKLPILTFAADTASYTITRVVGAEVHSIHVRDHGPLEDEAVVASMFIDPPEGSDVHVEFKLPVVIAFEDERRIIDTAEAIWSYVLNTVVPKLAPFFPPRPSVFSES
jgi:hypothetical protein